jgi:hypothetical protein
MQALDKLEATPGEGSGGGIVHWPSGTKHYDMQGLISLLEADLHAFTIGMDLAQKTAIDRFAKIEQRLDKQGHVGKAVDCPFCKALGPPKAQRVYIKNV